MKFWRVASAAAAVMVMLAACSGEPSIDPMAIQAELTMEPAGASAGENVELLATLSGTAFTYENTDVDFEIRKGGEIMQMPGVFREPGVYYTRVTFPEPGSYEIYIHIYVEDLHVIEKSQVDIQ